MEEDLDMRQICKGLLGFAMACLLAGCATTPPTGPVQVTRFHDADAMAQLGASTVFIESAPSAKAEGLALAPYKAAVAQELSKLGYSEAAHSDAAVIAQVRVEHFTLGDERRERGPVSVGVGGSTGSYGSGVGLGIGINLGGGKSQQRLGTKLSVTLRRAEDNVALWEGRAELAVGSKSALAEPAANAPAVAEALFRNFPGGNGETIEVEVNE